MLLLCVCAGGNKKQIEKAKSMLYRMWDSVKFAWEIYVDALLKLEPSPHSLVFGSYFVKYLQSKKEVDLIGKCKVRI